MLNTLPRDVFGWCIGLEEFSILFYFHNFIAMTMFFLSSFVGVFLFTVSTSDRFIAENSTGSQDKTTGQVEFLAPSCSKSN